MRVYVFTCSCVCRCVRTCVRRSTVSVIPQQLSTLFLFSIGNGAETRLEGDECNVGINKQTKPSKHFGGFENTLLPTNSM